MEPFNPSPSTAIGRRNSSAALVHALQTLVERELIYLTDHTVQGGKPIYAPYNPYLAAWFKYR